jgi:hypothetical protein
MWPQGTRQWEQTRVLIVSADRERRNQLVANWSTADPLIAKTPLEMIVCLEVGGPSIGTVVLSDVVGSATVAELAEFLEEHYPFVRVITQPRDRTEQHAIKPSPSLYAD